MKKPIEIIKNNALGIAVVAFVTLLIASAGYAVYFALNRLPQLSETNQVADVQTEDVGSEEATDDNELSNSYGFSTKPSDKSSQVLGQSIDNNFAGFSNAKHADPETNNTQTTKGGQTVKPSVQGISQTGTGITPTAVVSKESKPKDYPKPDNDDDIEVEVSKYPEIERGGDDITYIYRVEFNRAAKEEADEFHYFIDGKSCQNFKGEADLKSTTNIYVKIDKDYLDDYNDLEKSDYKIEVDGEEFDGTVYVPVCR